MRYFRRESLLLQKTFAPKISPVRKYRLVPTSSPWISEDVPKWETRRSTDQLWGQDGWLLAKFFFLRVYGQQYFGLPARPSSGLDATKSNVQPSWPNKLGHRSIKDSGNFFAGRGRLVPSGQGGSVFPVWVANHSAGFNSSCPLAQLAV